MGIAAATSSPGWRYRSGSASSGACSRPCRRRRSSAVTARPSPPRGQCVPRPVASNFSREPLAEADTSGTRFRPCPKVRMGGVGRRVYDRCVLRRLRIENLVLIREAELELAPGLNAITGETGAGKTILAQALGLLLGAKGDDSYVGAAGDEAYVEAELDLLEELEELEELRPEDEDALVVSRRVFADGRTRAYAWGRAAAREDVSAAVERVVAMSGQFEQRRLARPSYQLEVLDRFCGEEQLRRRAAARTAWRELLAARRRHVELTADAAAVEARLAGLRALVEDTEGLETGEEERLRSERERLRHLAELGEAAASAAAALAPDEGE